MRFSLRAARGRGILVSWLGWTMLWSSPLSVAGCGAAPQSFEVSSWGTIREALREGKSEGRVRLDEVVTDRTVGVGALAGLAGEVTIAGGRAWVATVEGESATVAEAEPDAEATVLATAEVPAWRQVAAPDCASYRELEDVVRGRLLDAGFDLSEPVPVRIHGRAPRIDLHVIAGNCPIANPAGPPPWRYSGAMDHVDLIGFFVEGAAGRFTHHGRSSHLHALASDRMGHLDEVVLEDVTVEVPARR